MKRCNEKNFLASHHQKQFERLFVKLPQFFEPIEVPSLLHGDLWSGNFMCNTIYEPVLIDPAVYYGHRSMDLGMTTLFGGFDKAFYDAYNYHFPLPHNYKAQWKFVIFIPSSSTFIYLDVAISGKSSKHCCSSPDNLLSH